MRIRTVLVVVVLAGAATISYGQTASLKEKSDADLRASGAKLHESVSTQADLSVKAATDDPNYVIGPEDELIINVWKEADISRAVPVRPDGKISLALVNDVQASGRTPMQLGADITEKLKTFISEPQVTVIVSKINSQRIFVVGEVLKTGAFTLVPNMTAVDAISSAGGFTPFAKKSKAYILRKENGKTTTIPFNYKEVVKKKHSEQDVVLRPGDRIVVP